MSLSVRVIPCLDVDNGRVVKGVNFLDLVDAGDPVELASRYGEQGADEITFLDVTATVDNRSDNPRPCSPDSGERLHPAYRGWGCSVSGRRGGSARARRRQNWGEQCSPGQAGVD
jgi:hypothetical protein